MASPMPLAAPVTNATLSWTIPAMGPSALRTGTSS
jgi:hypothetical protein